MAEEISAAELMYLFQRTDFDMRWQSTADSTEYLALVTYLVDRNSAQS